MKKYLLPQSGNFYKANLHCHSTVSDGALSPAELKKLYQDHGYSIIAFTDHDVMIPHHDLTDEKFLALTGYEMEVDESRPAGAPYVKTCHMCLIALSPDTKEQVCWHREKYLFGNAANYRSQVKFDESLPDYRRHYTHECISDMMQKGRDAGFFVTYNHPSWSMEEYPDYIGYNGMHAMEICNFGCCCEGFEDYVPQIYDSMLRGGKRIYAIGTDDNHNRMDDSCGAFTVIRADALKYRTITSALEKGHFYASQGPEIHELWLEEDTVHIKCSPAKKIFLNTGVRRARFALAKEGETITEAVFKVRPEDVYFRLTVIDNVGKPANTNAYFVDEWM